jgi:hypothetical protein
MQIVIPIITALIGALIGGLGGVLLRSFVESRRDKKKAAYEFYERFILDTDFRKVSKNVGAIRRQWQGGDRSMLKHFLVLPEAEIPKESVCDNGVTPHQNLSLALHFWAAIYTCIKLGLVDEQLLRALMANLWCWNDSFYMVFLAAHNAEPDSRHHSPPPLWVEAVPKLHDFFFPKNDA